MRLFEFVRWNFFVVAIILFCLQQQKLCPKLCRIERCCNYFANLPSQRSLTVTTKRSKRSKKWWVPMGGLLPAMIFVARANLAFSSALPRKYRISAFSVCLTWSWHCLISISYWLRTWKEASICNFTCKWHFGQNRLRDAATASLSRCLSFVCLLSKID